MTDPRALGVLLAVILLPLYLTGLDADGITHGDEAYWIQAGARSAARVAAGDLRSPDWQTGAMASVLDVDHPTETAATRNPKLGALLIGAGVRLADAPLPARWSRDYGFGRSVEWNRRNGFLPARETLRAGRLPVALLGVAGAVALYALLCGVVHRGWAFAVALLYATSPLVWTAARRAMLDGPALAFSLGAVLAAAAVCRAPRRLAPMLAAGLLCGAALASKLNAAVLVPVLVLAFGLEAVRRRDPRLLGRAALAGVLALAVFVGTNPTLYVAPVEGMLSMLRIGGEVGGLGRIFPGVSLPTLASRVEAAARFLLVDGGVVGGRLGVPVDLLLLPAGAVLLVRRARGDATARLCALWLVCGVTAVCVWPPVRWDRYFLPALPPIAVAEALALGAAGSLVAERFARARTDGDA
ncbi:MAG: ArnT family glycosyltransferase [Myxococcota bacterium]